MLAPTTPQPLAAAAPFGAKEIQPAPPRIPTMKFGIKDASHAPDVGASQPEKLRTKGGKRKGKKRASDAAGNSQGTHGSNPRKGPVKPNKWADKCMYAELLEMDDTFGAPADGVPDAIESAFVAVTPVPVGKRCLAVTHQTCGIAGIGA